MEASKDPDEKEEATAFVELLTPLAKAGNSGAGRLVAAEAIQAIDGFAKLCKSNVPAGFPGRQ